MEGSKRKSMRMIGVLMMSFSLGWVFLAGNCWAGNAILKVISDPEGAKVTVDTGQEGITPCTLEVPPGKRNLVIKARGFIAKNMEVDASAAEPTEIKVRLVPIPTTMRPDNPRYCQIPGIAGMALIK